MVKTKLLIIDDEETIVESMARVFARKGYEVSTAMSGDEAIEQYRVIRPDISLIDVHMIDSPEEGIRILEEIKKINPDAMCIMLTRITKQEVVQKAKALGAWRYLLKPFQAAELIKIVQEAETQLKGGADG